jgi:membrane protein DedA with SNARE-associated domain/rhodanese-related sulfurtransferase
VSAIPPLPQGKDGGNFSITATLFTMDFLLARVAEHGYPILFTIVFLEAVGMPVPAAIALLLAGGMCAKGALQTAPVILGAIGVMALGDTLLFFAGRYTGWWLLGVLCRISWNPEACILSSAQSFYRRGRITLVFAKFIPGINTMAPPLAGSMGMPQAQFFPLDLAGAAIYVLVYWGIGFVFSSFLTSITAAYNLVGHAVEWLLGAGVLVYLTIQIRSWSKARAYRTVPLIDVHEAARRLSTESLTPLVLDVRSHGYYDPGAMRIQGSVRMEPTAIASELHDFPKDRELYLYCTCVREATSARVAHELRKQGYRPHVIRGGLRTWKKAGLPLEPVPEADIVQLPAFS